METSQGSQALAWGGWIREAQWPVTPRGKALALACLGATVVPPPAHGLAQRRSGSKLVIEASEAESQMSDGLATRDTVLGEISESLSLPGASSEGAAAGSISQGLGRNGRVSVGQWKEFSIYI